jgi:hypothetical protein
MGYDIHITRKNDWADESGLRIALAEWKSVVENDPELTLDRAPDGTDLASASFLGEEGVLWWDDGEIVSKYPNEQLLAKMLALAELLNAKVQGGDGEVYQAGGVRTEQSPPASAPRLGFWSRLGGWLRWRRAKRQWQAASPAFRVGCRVRDVWGSLGRWSWWIETRTLGWARCMCGSIMVTRYA